MTTSVFSVGRGTIRAIGCAGAVLALLSTGTSADQAIDRGDDDLAGVVRELRTGPRRASGSSPKRRTSARSSCGSSSPTTQAGT